MDEQETDSLLCPNCQVPLQNRCCPECSTTDTHEQQATNGRNNGGCETNSSPSDESLRNHLHDIVKEHGLSGITQAVIDDLYASKVTIKICVVGQSCTGKSYLINSMRGLKPKDVGAAKVGVIQTTIKISQYPDPKYPNIVYFDVPGFGNPEYPKGKYLKTIAIETYAFFIFVSDSIISENDAWLANEIKKLGRKMYFVRTKIDDAIRNNVSDNEMPESLTMKTIRDDYERSLVKYTISSHNIFLINNRDTSAFEFPLLRKQLTEDKNDLKKQELIRALKLVTIDVLEKERTLLEGRLYKPALLLSAAALLPVVDIYFDYKIFTYEENSYREAFGTDERSLSHIAQQMNVSGDETKTYGLNKETIFGSALSVVSFCAATGAGAAGAIQGLAQVTSYAFPIVGDVAASLISYPTSKFLLGKILNQRYEEALSIHGRYYEHLTQNMKCRKKYYKHIRKASADKMEGRHLSIIIDNMDQGKSSLPSFCTKSKSDAHLYRLQHHITRVNVHNTNQTYLFTWTDAFRPDANITLNALVHALSDLCKNFQRLPEVLYLHLDNYGMDNKNAFVLIFMAYLVKMKIFQKVKWAF